MSLLSRISGLLDSFQAIELEARDRYGAGGEDEVEEIIHRNLWRYIRNPLAPHPSKPGVFLESDFLVYVNASLFVVEVKRLIGRVVPDDDRRFLQQVKQGRYGEGVFVKRFSNPLQKTNSFARRLRSYLAEMDPRFRHVHIGAAAVFAPTADISAIHDPAGLIYARELPDFFLNQSRSDTHQRPWLVEAFTHVPTWDRIETTHGESMYGLFNQPALMFRDTSMRQLSIPFSEVAEVQLEPGHFLSDASEAKIKLLTGEILHARVAFGDIRLDRFGSVQVHKLRNLRRILPGVARFRGRVVPAASPRGRRSQAG
jgi:hypothetical protein